MTRIRRWAVRLVLAAGALVLLVGGLVALNGLVLADRQAPRMRHYADVAVTPSASAPGELTVVAYNVAKGFAHRGGLRFDSRTAVEARVSKMAAVVRAEKPDLLFLSEALTELAPCPVDQVERFARECGLPHVATGENYNLGVPGLRVVGGNAILSRLPLTPVANIDLAGRQPFWVTKNNRRALFASAEIGGKPVLLGALHNDSFDMRNNAAQARQLLEFIGDRSCVLAGDFNNRPGEESIRLVRDSGRFSGAFDGPPTYFEGKRAERLDYVFAPAAWELLESRVVPDDTSDHRPLVCRFRVR
ncbi:endonuclease/exonuclease/phosphatase family protein [Urbifossiella limnaea]|uniref:Endonuclease/Exonuclease/phosphatase family protein n=1 Tax=Urbifossiella limnaea TaxID=2528023 RepID=A0A517XZ04_9BACT|nr:endonuclease/exonuclease/phosphatase family protein [Urbifossiella limnaea]QDU22750.1 Endonuclease/Exonuclease/phosphatase family protein [Urbifossiella limnaea]